MIINKDIIKEFVIYKEVKQDIFKFFTVSYKGNDYIRIEFLNNFKTFTAFYNDYPINDYIQFEREYKLNTILNETQTTI